MADPNAPLDPNAPSQTPSPELLDRFQASQMSLANGPQVTLGEGAQARLGLLSGQTEAQKAATAQVGTVTDAAKQKMSAIDPSSFDQYKVDTSGISGTKFKDPNAADDAAYNPDDPTGQSTADNKVGQAQQEAQGALGKAVNSAQQTVQDVFKTRTDTLRKFSDGYNDWILGLPTSNVGTLGTANTQETQSLGLNQALAQHTGGNIGALAALGYSGVSSLDAAQLGGQIQGLQNQAQQNLTANQQAQAGQQAAMNAYLQSIDRAKTDESKFVDDRTSALQGIRDTAATDIGNAQGTAADGITQDATTTKTAVDAKFADRYKQKLDAEQEIADTQNDKGTYADLLSKFNALPDYLKNSSIGHAYSSALESRQASDKSKQDVQSAYGDVGYNEGSQTIGANVTTEAIQNALNHLPQALVGSVFQSKLQGELNTRKTTEQNQQTTAATEAAKQAAFARGNIRNTTPAILPDSAAGRVSAATHGNAGVVGGVPGSDEPILKPSHWYQPVLDKLSNFF